MIVTAKYRERFEYHITRARAIMESFVSESNVAILSDSVRRHNERFPVLRRVRTYVLWISFHGLIAVGGMILTMIALIR
ncbi:hypothetical protein Aab01nite_82650 [Paractinoplanes abujensis]|uniref:Uncharacterized protein n=1 Tax=Paractinoplanes abujensis TaxID=882441 RepID=A0A7W7G0T8_9ACTN|nr:hypothetical protein [Actinoplanes abujensis]GID24675.1 hypothetical protein Aab01nite_82650 [Actinoplanes abujensis]